MADGNPRWTPWLDRLFTLHGTANIHIVEESSYRGRPKDAFDYKYKGEIGGLLLGQRSSFGAKLTLIICFFWWSILNRVEGHSYKPLWS